jgi:hypothetical protein
MTAMRSCALIALIALGLACGGSGAAPSPSAAGATQVAEDFLADMQAGAWHAAFSRLHPDLQAECGSAERLREVVEAAGQRPESWTLREPRVRSDALISGPVVTAGGDSSIVEMTLLDVDGAWKVRFWSAGNRELCLED